MGLETLTAHSLPRNFPRRCVREATHQHKRNNCGLLTNQLLQTPPPAMVRRPARSDPLDNTAHRGSEARAQDLGHHHPMFLSTAVSWTCLQARYVLQPILTPLYKSSTSAHLRNNVRAKGRASTHFYFSKSTSGGARGHALF